MRLANGARGKRLAVLGGLCALALAVGAAPAQAYRPLLSEAALETPPGQLLKPPPEGQIEDACGLAIAPGSGDLYVSDYYHRAVDVFAPPSAGNPGVYKSQIALPGGPFTGLGINTLDAVCGLAFDSGGNLYANEWHEGVLRLRPTEFGLDGGESTAVALDAAGNVYVDDRTYVAKYEAPVGAGEEPVAKIGLGTLGEGYGLAVSADGARVYVADSASNSIKLYKPSVSLTTPAAGIAHSFTSLVDGSLAIDPTNEHLLALDDLQPGYEHPEAAVDEFSAAGAFLDQIRGPLGAPIVDGEPSGLALDGAGNLYVTVGNSELANAFEFGPYSATAPLTLASTSSAARAAAATSASSAAGTPATDATHHHRHSVPATASETIQRDGVRVSFDAEISPRRLPRSGAAPVRFALSAKIASTDGSAPPQLRRISIEINRYGHLNPAGLPSCGIEAIQPSTTAGALQACRRALVGEGRFRAKVLVPEQAPFPSEGKIVAFNGRWHGKPAILAHVFGRDPVPTSYTLPFVIGPLSHGTYGTTLSASLPRFTGKWGYVTGISLDLGRGYLSASCPAPAGFPGASFPLSHASLSFAGRKQPIEQTLTRSCEVRG
jgi:DNA-binding beta-propeller fold protein YncE